MTPTHAYIPGKTPRHPEDAFAAIHASVRSGMSAEELAATDAFQTGLRYLASGYCWEAHEVFEPVWMALPDGDERRFVQALIQLANGRLKLLMDRPKAALRLAVIATDLLRQIKAEQALGQSVADALAQVEELQKIAKSGNIVR